MITGTVIGYGFGIKGRGYACSGGNSVAREKPDIHTPMSEAVSTEEASPSLCIALKLTVGH